MSEDLPFYVFAAHRPWENLQSPDKELYGLLLAPGSWLAAIGFGPWASSGRPEKGSSASQILSWTPQSYALPVLTTGVMGISST